jgi:hypothetical protein
MVRRHKHMDLQHRSMRASRIQLWPILVIRLHKTSFASLDHHLDPRSLCLGHRILLLQLDSYSPAPDSPHKNQRLFLSLVPYLQDLFHLHVAL